MTQRLQSYRAAWVFPISRPPIENGYVTIANNIIVEVGAGTPPPSDLHDMGDSVLMPALVNAHTHLEFSELAAPLGYPGIPFADWLKLVVNLRRQRDDGDPSAHARALEVGLDESRATGTALLGEIASSPWPLPHGTRPAMLFFLEQLGLRFENVPDRITRIRDRLEQIRTTNSRPVSVGISPHAPYSVHRQLMRRLLTEASRCRAPVAIHLAESTEEMEFLQNRSGPIAELLIDLGVWSADDACCTIEEILQMLSRDQLSVLVHGNYLTVEHLDAVSQMRESVSIVYCPRTHQFFRHAPYPLRAMMERGINVAVGTDSRASNPDLNLWRELQTIRNCHPDLPWYAILAMGTLNGARALGQAHAWGSLEPGKRAEICAIRMGKYVPQTQLETIFEDSQPEWLDGLAHQLP